MPTINENEDGYLLSAAAITAIERVCARYAQENQREPARRSNYTPFVQGVMWGKLDEDLLAGDTATMSIWDLNSSDTEADTTANVDVWDVLMGTGKKLVTGTKVVVARMGNHWIVISSDDCEEAA
jgi:hypothetical protein